jgi:glyoxylase-like metal-dependent hydrolase (beta-lactamase superfamily II)
MKELKLYLNYAGYCSANEKHAIRNGKDRQIKFHALFGLIQHPEKGWILYDTGYTRRFYNATKKFPNKLYALATKVIVKEEDEIKTQLQQFGLVPSDIKHIIITHFHADHIGGLKDFDEATLYCSAAAFHQVKKINSFFSFRKGILKSLLPDDIDNRIKIIENICLPLKDAIFEIKYDLFNDDSLFIYPLPGHAAGQVGVLLKTNKQFYLLIADACWIKRSFEEFILPHPIVKLFFDSWTDFKNSLKKVYDFHKANPQVVIVPTHCYETTEPLISKKGQLNEL